MLLTSISGDRVQNLSQSWWSIDSGYTDYLNPQITTVIYSVDQYFHHAPKSKTKFRWYVSLVYPRTHLWSKYWNIFPVLIKLIPFIKLTLNLQVVKWTRWIHKSYDHIIEFRIILWEIWKLKVIYHFSFKIWLALWTLMPLLVLAWMNQ